MATAKQLTLNTPRDRDIFLALDRSPLTVRQLLKLSQTFTDPFTSERRVQERLAKLCAAGRVRRWQYATASRGILNYYRLSTEGYRILYGQDAPLPRSRAFSPVGVARQHHTRCLADFVVHTLVGASHAGVTVPTFWRENALQLQVGNDCLYPDAAFTLRRPDGFPFRFFLELDNASERVRSTASLDSWERKVRFYDAYQDHVRPARFHVLAVTTGTAQRAQHILDAARGIMSNSQRSLVYGITLSDYLGQEQPITRSCFRDNCGRNVVLVLPDTRFVATHPTTLAPVARV